MNENKQTKAKGGPNLLKKSQYSVNITKFRFV